MPSDKSPRQLPYSIQRMVVFGVLFCGCTWATLAAIGAYGARVLVQNSREANDRQLFAAGIAAGDAAVRLFPYDPEGRFLSVKATLANGGNTAAAVPALAAVQDTFPFRPAFLRLYGQVLLEQKQFSAAYSALKEAVRLAPVGPSADNAARSALMAAYRADLFGPALLATPTVLPPAAEFVAVRSTAAVLMNLPLTAAAMSKSLNRADNSQLSAAQIIEILTGAIALQKLPSFITYMTEIGKTDGADPDRVALALTAAHVKLGNTTEALRIIGAAAQRPGADKEVVTTYEELRRLQGR